MSDSSKAGKKTAEKGLPSEVPLILDDKLMMVVRCTTEFEGWHHWPAATVEYAYLRSSHRHMFKIEVKVEVKHAMRAIEFIHLKHLTEQACLEMQVFSRDHNIPKPYSCEEIARIILTALYDLKELGKPNFLLVGVSEDGENGSEVTYFNEGFGSLGRYL
jgi:hypothetical protein